MIEHTVQITIIDDSSREQCDASCGVDWSSPEAIDLASQRIKDRFGEKVQLECLDLSKAVGSRDAVEWDEVIKQKNLSLPALFIDGHPRIAGEFDIRQLLDAIEADIEIGARR